MNADSSSPEELLDAFKAAALSVTKLYKTSAAANAKARADGYQDCLDDLLSFLDRQAIGLRGEGDGSVIRRWITDRQDGRESEDETDKAETASSPELHRSASNSQLPTLQSDVPMRTDSAPPLAQPAPATPSVSAVVEEPQVQETQFRVPTSDTFNFQSQIQYPQDSWLEIANLDLSDNRATNDGAAQQNSSTAASFAVSRSQRNRHGSSGIRSGSRSSNALGRGAGTKRKLNLPEIFDLGSLGNSKDMFGGRGGKRRHL